MKTHPKFIFIVCDGRLWGVQSRKNLWVDTEIRIWIVLLKRITTPYSATHALVNAYVPHIMTYNMIHVMLPITGPFTWQGNSVICWYENIFDTFRGCICTSSSNIIMVVREWQRNTLCREPSHYYTQSSSFSRPYYKVHYFLVTSNLFNWGENEVS